MYNYTIYYYILAPTCRLIDLCIVIDSSGSIRDNNPKDGSYDNWELLLNFVKEVDWQL